MVANHLRAGLLTFTSPSSLCTSWSRPADALPEGLTSLSQCKAFLSKSRIPAIKILVVVVQVKEMDILARVEKLTNPIREEGEWMIHLDLVEEGDKLAVKEQDSPGKCGTECKTIQKAAVDILEDNDTDMAEILWRVRLLVHLHTPSGPTCRCCEHCWKSGQHKNTILLCGGLSDFAVQTTAKEESRQEYYLAAMWITDVEASSKL